MIPNDNAIMLYKFSEKQWIQKLLDGELSFSCAGAFELRPFFEQFFRKTDFSFLETLAAQGFPDFRFEQGFFKTSQNVELLFLRPDAI